MQRTQRSAMGKKINNHVTLHRPHHRYTKAKFRVVWGQGFLGAKTNGNMRFVKHKRLRSSGKSTLNKNKFIILMK